MPRIATAQMVIEKDPRVNGRTIRSLMREAHAGGARLVLFPEGALSGYAKAQISSWEEVDWKGIEAEADAIARLAGELGIWAVVGCGSERPAPERPRNSLLVFSDAGLPVARYDKRICSHSEITDWYSRGAAPVVLEVDGYRFCCILCIEIQFPELFLEYERLDVDCVLFSAYSDDSMFGVVAQGHAEITCAWIAVSTPASCGDQLPAHVIGPDGRVQAGGVPSTAQGLVFADLDKRAPEFDIALNKARPWRRRARAEQVSTLSLR